MQQGLQPVTPWRKYHKHYNGHGQKKSPLWYRKYETSPFLNLGNWGHALLDHNTGKFSQITLPEWKLLCGSPMLVGVYILWAAVKWIRSSSQNHNLINKYEVMQQVTTYFMIMPCQKFTSNSQRASSWQTLHSSNPVLLNSRAVSKNQLNQVKKAKLDTNNKTLVIYTCQHQEWA